MGDLGYVRNGKRYYGKPSAATESSQFKAHEHAKQRREHAADIVQPWNADGTISQDFAWLYPEQADMYRKES